MKKFNIYETAGKLGKVYKENRSTVALATVYAVSFYTCYWLFAAVWKIKKNTSKILEMLD